ncbi:MULTISPECIES: MerR family transcriptional regulator [unclassified Ensifer]|uniref:MerR family transcriptional regulator n=1 Tax=unclassified Ensifer TaxID=2633371 RepID=UPI0008136B72|nr:MULTISPECIES: MerR family transcriptional regulator [unclassified Ensifer]OCP23604.1 MerR family transcriptional regulator [Ensifer sp. LC384]OCP24291.1 MerR family transcriptional regulator [Ensifer sp. LC54]
MNIGELAKRTGLTSSRIRFYESAGLLNTVERRPNGYRTYPSEAVLVLELITTAQNAGFSLDEIRTLLPPDLEQWEHGVLTETLRRKVADIEAMEVRLSQSKAQLIALINDIETKPDDIDCATNARRVLTRMLGREVEATGAGANGIKLAKANRRRSTGG